MAARALLLLALLVGCGRIGFGLDGESEPVTPGGPGGPADDAAVDTPPPSANLVFVTSRAHPIIGIAGMADQLCAMHASEAGHAGTFRAWLSSAGSTALSRIAGARGWVRRDGQVVADLPSDIAQGKLYVPIRLDEHGGGAASNDLVVTATGGDGMPSGPNCANFTSDTGDVIVGTPLGTTSDWTETTSRACGNSARLYCFQVDRSVPVAPATTTGRIAFVTTATWDRGDGLVGADALCGSEALVAGLTGTFAAVLATTTASAASRFSAAGPTWIRRDGVAIAATAAEVLSGTLVAPPNVTITNMYYGGPVATGATSIAALATATSSCADWTATTGNGSINGSSGTISSRWFDDARYIAPCSSDDVIYCFQK
jgi:hypothetical protein